MKKFKSIILIWAIILSGLNGISNVFAATCALWSDWRANTAWTSWTCTFPTGAHLVNWNLTVWAWTLTVPNNSILVINLGSRKITFTSWKINLVWNAAVKYISNYYFWNPTDSNNSSNATRTDCNVAANCTECPGWQKAYNEFSLTDAPASVTSSNITSGLNKRVYCH